MTRGERMDRRESDDASRPCEVEAIDVHAHYGSFNRPELELTTRLTSGGPERVVELAAMARTRLTIVSPSSGLTPRGEADTAAGNDEALRLIPRFEGLAFWVIVNPLQPRTYDQAGDMLEHPKCLGIKIHPEEHCYPIREHGRAIFEFADRLNAIVLTHSGEQRSLPADVAQLADDFPDLRLILAHHGCGWDGHLDLQVCGLQATKSRNVFIDTSSASSMITNLIEWGVQEVGAGRFLYGTDQPGYFAPCQRQRIDMAEISDADKRMILRGNAERLFGAERIREAIGVSTPASS